MKIGLLTLPVVYNYGGILQAFALYTSINRLGAECVFLDVDWPVYPYYRRPLTVLKRIVNRVTGKKKSEIIPYWRSKRTERIISQNTRVFVEKYIANKTRPIIHFSADLDKYDAYVVGSDQVWRKSSVLNIYNYLFDFVGSNKKKSSYAASFGVDYWEFSTKATKQIMKYLSEFDTITVRESSAVSMIKDKLNLEAHHVLDPTLLLTKEDYNSLLSTECEENNKSFVFSYILDRNNEKNEAVQILSSFKKIPVVDIMPHSELSYFHSPKDHVYAPVEEWLRNFRDCEMIITDSFHGTVFSIIYNKPFYVLTNKKRGNTRMECLLKMFGLSDRMIGNKNEIEIKDSEEIDWNQVNQLWNNYRSKSLEYLKKMIS